MLGLHGALRAAVDLVAPRPASRSPLSDRAIGPLVADKLGQRVVDVLVDPLVGGIHAGRVRDLSAAAVFPPVLAAGQARGSMMRALQAGAAGGAPASQGPAFFTLRDGMGTLPDLLARTLARARGRDLDARRDGSCTEVRAGEPRWIVETSTAALPADGVVLATPAPATATLLGPLDGDAASLCASIDAAGVVVTTLEFGDDDLALPDGGTGVLVPVGTRFADRAFLTTAVTFFDRKWPHLARDGARLRARLGRPHRRPAVDRARRHRARRPRSARSSARCWAASRRRGRRS